MFWTISSSFISGRSLGPLLGMGLGLAFALGQLGYYLYQHRQTLMVRIVWPLAGSRIAPKLAGLLLVLFIIMFAPDATFAASSGTDTIKKTWSDGVKNILNLLLLAEGGLILLMLVGGGVLLTVGGINMRLKQIGAGMIKGAIIGGALVGGATIIGRIIVEIISSAGGQTIELPTTDSTGGN
jgi:hypothetical protein